jgi:nitroreductase/NAD-dependent dihydropyrimidine dehydrogenase PreA subunit
MTSPLTVDTTLCRACGACVAECTLHWVAPGGLSGATDNQHVDPSRPDCVHCLHCYAVCPAGAIRLSEEYIPLAEAEAWRDVRPEALESLRALRRSTRRFQQKPVPRDLIARVVAAGCHIPSGGNRHAYEFTVLTDPAVKGELLAEFSRYYDRIRKLMENSALMTVAGLFLSPYERAFLNDPDYGQRMKELLDRFHAGDDPVFYHAPAAIVIHTGELIPTPQQDSVLAGFAMALVAQTLGLGTCFVSLAEKGLSASKRCKALAGIPAQDHIHAVLLLGYPDVTYLRPTPKPEKAVHWV